MLSLTTGAAVRATVADPALDPQLRALLAARARQLENDTEPDLGDVAHFHAVEPGDGPAEAAAALGFPPDVNLVDGSRHGDMRHP